MKITLSNNQINKISHFNKQLALLNSVKQNSLTFSPSFMRKSFSNDEFFYEKSDDKLNELQIGGESENDYSEDTDSEEDLILTKADINAVKQRIGGLKFKIKSYESAITKLEEEIEKEREKESRIPYFVSGRKISLTNQLNLKIKSLNRAKNELQEKEKMIEEFNAQTTRNPITRYPQRYLPIAGLYPGSALKKAIGDFVPIENQDKKPQYLLYDMSDPRNIAVIERAEKLLPKKSKFYADCDSKEKWAPAAYLAKLGFGDIKKLKQMVEEGKLKGVYKDTPVNGTTKRMLWIEIKKAEPKLDQLRRLEGYMDVRSLGAARSISPQIFLNLIMENKIKSIREYVYSKDYDAVFVNVKDPQIREIIKKHSAQAKN